MPEGDQTASGKARESRDEPEPTYEAEDLRERARGMLGVSPHAIAGALSGERRKTHTEVQAQKLVEKFLEAKTDYSEQAG